MSEKWVLEIVKEDGKTMQVESSNREQILKKARAYYRLHPECEIKVYQINCIFNRETISR